MPNYPPPFYPVATLIDMIAGRLQQTRRNEALKIREVARKLEVTEKQYRQWERGEEAIPAAHLVRCAKVLDIGIETFFPDPQGPLIPRAEDLSVFNECRLEIQKVREDFWSVVGHIEDGRYNYLGDFTAENRAQRFIKSIWDPSFGWKPAPGLKPGF